MINELEKTGLIIGAGTLSPKDAITILNTKVNELIEIVNTMLKGKLDLNIELETPGEIYTLDQALALSKNIRRAKGMKLRFKGNQNRYEEYSYVGPDLTDENWTDTKYWLTSIGTIDGGTF